MAEPTTTHRIDGSMSLLVDTMGDALDPAYAEAAGRRERAGRAGTSRPYLAVALLLLVGLGTGVASAQVRRAAHAADGSRSRLLGDVRQATADTDALARDVERLRAQVAATRSTVLGDGALGRQLSAQVAALEAATGQTAVTGPGLVVTLADAADATDGTANGGNGRGGQLGDGRVYDRDVQDVVNALWAAGAEAVSINGQRLTALTAIRSAGEAVLVDFRPLSPPYRISAVGDVDAMEPAFADSATARRFVTYTSLYGLGFSTRRAGRLALPAAAPPELHSAQAAQDSGRPQDTGRQGAAGGSS